MDEPVPTRFVIVVDVIPGGGDVPPTEGEVREETEAAFQQAENGSAQILWTVVSVEQVV